MTDGFLSRWSKRKREAATGVVEDQRAALEPKALDGGSVISDLAPESVQPSVNKPMVENTATSEHGKAVGPPPEFSVDDAKKAGSNGEISAFTDLRIDPSVRNTAFKSLFARPEFNVMDGLDVYIEDFNLIPNLTKQELGLMANVKNLLRLEEPDSVQANLAESTGATTESAVIHSDSSSELTVDSVQVTGPVDVNEPANDTNVQASIQGVSSSLNIAAQQNLDQFPK